MSRCANDDDDDDDDLLNANFITDTSEGHSEVARRSGILSLNV
jgi:hypothetical protein